MSSTVIPFGDPKAQKRWSATLAYSNLRHLRNLREIFICVICEICERHPLKRVNSISIVLANPIALVSIRCLNPL